MSKTYFSLASVILTAALLSACASLDGMPPAGGHVSIQRTAHGVPHIQANDLRALGFGAAYAHAQDNVCQTAQHLVTARGERAATFGSAGSGLLGMRSLPNEQIDLFVAAHMNDAALARAWRTTSTDVQALVRGYVEGYNRYLADHAGRLPAPCAGQSWVQPMTLADYYRVYEITAIQAGLGALADAMLAAQPPKSVTSASPPVAPLNLAEAAQAMREAGVIDPPFGSNAWSFGKEVTEGGRGMLLGNPHFPWVGANRFYQMHLTVPGQLDVMGAALGLSPLVQIGFNKDVAWSHTVSSGKRFTLHELQLVPGHPTRYVMDGQPLEMAPQTVTIRARGVDGVVATKQHTVWRTRFGPVVVNPRAGLNWSATQAYALQDANQGNVRAFGTWLAFARAGSVQDMRAGMANMGLPWVNTVAADRDGNALYADASVVPDVDAAQLARCAPSQPARRLLAGAGLVVLNGARSDCDWVRRGAGSLAGITPLERMPVAMRSDWVHNSNDSFVYTHPAQHWPAISPLVGDNVVRRPRTRAEWIEIAELLSRGPVTLSAMQQQILSNRNLMGRVIVPDLLAACPQAPDDDTRAACEALRRWGRTSELDDPGAVLFREFWRTASTIPAVYRQPFDPSRPVDTPQGLAMDNRETAAKVWESLAAAVGKLRQAGLAPHASLGQAQRPVFSDEAVFLHGGDEIEGVLNNVGDRGAPGVTRRGLRIDYGTSYLQTVGFDERGPIAYGLLTYGQSSLPNSEHQTDQLKLFARKEWPRLPFHPEEVASQRVGDVLRLQAR